MLVLTRKSGESIYIEDVKVTVLRSGNKVRLGIEADASVRVRRGELVEASRLEETGPSLFSEREA